MKNSHDQKKPIICAVVGRSGIGKSTFTKEFTKTLKSCDINVLSVPTDCYYSQIPEGRDLSTYDFDDPQNFQMSLLKEDIEKLCNGKIVTTPRYVWSTGFVVESCTLDPSRVDIIILDGIFMTHPSLVEIYNHRSRIYHVVPSQPAQAFQQRRYRTEEDVIKKIHQCKIEGNMEKEMILSEIKQIGLLEWYSQNKNNANISKEIMQYITPVVMEYKDDCKRQLTFINKNHLVQLDNLRTLQKSGIKVIEIPNHHIKIGAYQHAIDISSRLKFRSLDKQDLTRNVERSLQKRLLHQYETPDLMPHKSRIPKTYVEKMAHRVRPGCSWEL